jgi:hypothetical protein
MRKAGRPWVALSDRPEITFKTNLPQRIVGVGPPEPFYSLAFKGVMKNGGVLAAFHVDSDIEVAICSVIPTRGSTTSSEIQVQLKT